MPVPYRFERDVMTECEQCGSELENSGVVVMYKGNPLHLCVECAVKRFEKMMSKIGKKFDECEKKIEVIQNHGCCCGKSKDDD